MVASVGARGFAATTLTDIVGRARVSRSTFYDHFSNKEHCFIEAVHAGMDIIRTRIREEMDRLPAEADPGTQLASTIITLCSVIAAEPDFARLILVESLQVDDLAVGFRNFAVHRFTLQCRRFHDQARLADPNLPELSDALISLVPDAISERTRRVLISDGAGKVPELAPVFVEFACTVLGLRPPADIPRDPGLPPMTMV
ncbi:MAG: helix-turn-helix transcriptional regulator [Nocardia sp.]|nr:helix-turn-helix transcriptional regulator [Nocardia sp.]